MTTWRKYGLVWVSAGLLISGSLWWQRRGSHIRGEDCAELISAVMERQAVAYLTGTNMPVLASNNVPAWIRMTDIRDKILHPARTMATNDVAGGLPVIYWLDGDVKDGDMLSGYDAQWYAGYTQERAGEGVYSGMTHTITTYYLTAPSNNVTDYALTTASRMPGAGWTFWPWVSATNAPIGRSMFGTGSGWCDDVSSNWWTNIGNGTNSYAYWSERYQDNGRVTITLLSGGGFTDVSPEIIFTPTDYAAPQNIRLQNTANNTAAYYQIEVSGVGHTHVGVAPWPVAAAVNPRVKRNDVGGSAFVSSGGSIDLAMASEFLISTPWDVNLSYSGDLSGPSAVSAAEAPYMYAPFTVTCPAGGGGTLTASCPQTGAQQTVVIVDSAQNADIEVSGAVARQISNLGVAEIGISLADPPEPNQWTQSAAISTNYLNQAANVLSNLNRTIYICGIDALTSTSRVYEAWGFSADTNYFCEGDRPASTVPQDWQSLASKELSLDVSATNVVAWDGKLIYYDREANFWTDCFRDLRGTPDPQIWEVDSLSWVYFDTRRLDGCTLPYPSDYALASQYVAKVSIFAVTMTAPFVKDALDVGQPYWESSTIQHTVSGSYADLNDMMTYGFGIGADPAAEWPANPLETASLTSSGEFVLAAYKNSPKPFMPPRASFRLLASAEDPTNRVMFSLGTLTPSHPDLKFTYEIYDKRTWDDGDYESMAYWDTWEVNLTMRVVCFAVVVDWKWRHLNPAKPYEPEPYTPPWVSANTDAP